MTMSLFTFLPMKMEEIECSETSAYKIQTPVNYPEENIQHSYFVFLSAHNEKRPKSTANAFAAHQVPIFFSVYLLYMLTEVPCCLAL
jgi:hypothetical protein